MKENKQGLCLSLDLDNQWSYLKTQGDTAWKSFPSYLDKFVEIALPVLQRNGLNITFFVVGQDAALEKNEAALKTIADAGYEIANHSFSHEPWFHLLDRSDIVREIAVSEHHIERVTGQKPVGFRGPGFSHSRTMLEVLAERDYLYDASQFPTFLGPLARLYFFCNSGDLSREEKEKRMHLFGKFSDCFKSLHAYRHKLEKGSLIEIPVTTMPIFRLPFHQSYLNYLATWNRHLGTIYGRFSFTLCRALGVTPSFLLHPLDFLGGDDVNGMSFFPGMQLTTAEKLNHLETLLGYLTRHFELIDMKTYCNTIDTPALPQRVSS